MSPTVEPQLDAPGAGLPAPELFVARKLISLKIRLGSRESFIRSFAEEREKIAELMKSCPPERRGERELVPRLRGLEDSSRYWSLWMTLDHLRIVNSGIVDTIAELSQGRSPEQLIGTADVKPDPAVGADIESLYLQGCDEFVTQISETRQLRTDARYPHPWFGPFDAFQWLGLASIHMGIHRKQIAAIISGLNS